MLGVHQVLRGRLELLERRDWLERKDFRDNLVHLVLLDSEELLDLQALEEIRAWPGLLGFLDLQAPEVSLGLQDLKANKVLRDQQVLKVRRVLKATVEIPVNREPWVNQVNKVSQVQLDRLVPQDPMDLQGHWVI